MRIMHVLLSPRQGGMETLVAALADKMQIDGHSVRVEFVDPTGNVSSRLKRLKHIYREIRRWRPDVIFAHSTIPIFYVRIAACVARRPSIAVMHSAADEWRHWRSRVIERLMWRMSDATAAVSSAKLAEYRSHFPAGAYKSILLENAVSEVQHDSDVGFAQAVHHTFFFLMAGRVVDQKQVVEAIQATKSLIARGVTNFTLRVAGEWPDHDYAQLVKKEIDSLTMPSMVEVLGNRNDVRSLMANADGLLHPSLSEASSLTLIEAGIEGLPVIVSDAVARTLPQCQVSLVFPPGDVEELANAMAICINEKRILRARAREVASTIRDRYSIEAAVARYVEAATKVLPRES